MVKALYEQVQLKRNIQLKCQECYSQRKELFQKVNELKKKLNKEQDDVERLENGHLARFFSELFGNVEQRLEKERQEYYEAKTKYDAALYQLKALESDVERYEKQLHEMKDIELEYQKAYEQKLKEIGEKDAEILEINQQIADSKLRQKEIEEAISEGQKAYHLANQAYDALNSANGWSTYDMLGGGMFADFAKYSHMDTAESLIHELQVHLSRFKTELADVKIEMDIQVSVDGFLRMADYVFDNIFTDWAVKDRISNALYQIQNTLSQIQRVLRYLDEMMNNEVQIENDLKAKLEKKIVEL